MQTLNSNVLDIYDDFEYRKNVNGRRVRDKVKFWWITITL